MKIAEKINRSFSAKLSFYVLLFTTTIFLISFFFFYVFTSRTINRAANEKAANLLDITKYKIENVFTTIKTVHSNIQWAVIDKGFVPDSLFSLTQEVVKNNPYIFGCAVAFEPNYFKEKGYYFSPFSSRQEDVIETIQLGNDTYDYFSMEWYDTPKQLNAPHWTDPYYDEGGGQMLMFTYSSPIYDSQDNFIGILTADVSLNWLTDMVNAVKPYPSSYCVLLGSSGTFIIHPRKEYIMEESIFSMAQKQDSKELAQIGTRMINGETGMAELKNMSINENHVDSYIYFMPLISNQWSLGMIIDKADVFEQLYTTRTIILILLAIGLILLFILCMSIVSRLTKPLRLFSISAREIAQGNFNIELPQISSKDEMNDLKNSFRFMQKELINYISELKETTSKKERIESELRIASDIQMGMIPKLFPAFPDREDVDLYAMLRSAKEVGGDLYDFFIENNKLYFTIGDVSGKGVPASLFMAVTRSLLRSVANFYEDPGEMLTSINSLIADTNDSNMFVTLFAGILYLDTGELLYCNAGHNPPVIIDAQDVTSFMKIKPNIPVGVFDGHIFQSERVQIAEGSVLFLYTDGLTEAENEDKELYSDSRLLTELEKIKSHNSKEMITTIDASVVQHAGAAEQSDDLTMLAIHYKRKQRYEKTTNH